MIKVLIADDNKEYAKALADYFSLDNELDVVGLVCNGREVIDFLEKNTVDILILDIVMPGLDGIGVLNAIKEMESKVKVIILSSLPPATMMEETIKLGAFYYIEKSATMSAILERIKMIHNSGTHNFIFPKLIEASEDADLENAVEKTLYELGMPTNLRGYHYIKTGCMIAYKENELLSQVTKALYPQISKLHKTTSSRVERAMRHAIETTFSRCDVKILDEFFGYTVDKFKGKPTNSEFITTIVNNIQQRILV